MSIRKDIVAEIKTRLETAGFQVSRKLAKLQDLRSDQFPFASITNGPETDTDVQMAVTDAQWDLHIILYVQAMETTAQPLNAQDVLDDYMALAVSALTSESTLNGLVTDIAIYTRDTDRGIYEPFGAADMVFRIKFQFDRTTQGG